MQLFFNVLRRSKPLAFSRFAAAAWENRFFCGSQKSPASRARQNRSSGIIWNRPQTSTTAILPNTCRSSRAGFTASRATARFSSAKKTGLIVGFFGRAHDCLRLRKASRQKRLRQGRRHHLKEGHDQIRHERRNHAVRAEVCRARGGWPFSGNTENGALFAGHWNLPW